MYQLVIALRTPSAAHTKIDEECILLSWVKSVDLQKIAKLRAQRPVLLLTPVRPNAKRLPSTAPRRATASRLRCLNKRGRHLGCGSCIGASKPNRVRVS